MSRIDELIAKYCPNGVEFCELQEIFITRNGYTPSTRNKAYWINGNVPWFRMEDIRKNGRILSRSRQVISKDSVKGGKLFPANSIIIATTATIGEHALITVPHLSNQRFTSLSLKSAFSARLNIRFVFYYCFILDKWCLENTTKSSFASVNMAGFRKFKFPIPPLEIQHEIVKVLDTFTELEAELEAELETELEVRQRQYEYYRDTLLSFDEHKMSSNPIRNLIQKHCPNGVEFRVLQEVARIRNGKDYKIFGEGNIPVYGSGGVMTKIDTAAYSKPSVLIPRKGSLNKLYYVDKPFWTVDTIFYTEINEYHVVPRFFYYFLANQHLEELNLAGGVPSLTQSVLNKIKVPVPPLEVQHEIVAILDKFDALVNDLSEGLPAEITARRQQYEYYRSRLLTFHEAT